MSCYRLDMVQRPRFLLLDEPTAALEPRETDRLLDVVASLRDKGTGIILVSHRLGEICRIGERRCEGRLDSSVAQRRVLKHRRLPQNKKRAPTRGLCLSPALSLLQPFRHEIQVPFHDR